MSPTSKMPVMFSGVFSAPWGVGRVSISILVTGISVTRPAVTVSVARSVRPSLVSRTARDPAFAGMKSFVYAGVVANHCAAPGA